MAVTQPRWHAILFCIGEYSSRVVVREVEWPRDVGAVARSLASSRAWFWLDGQAIDPEGAPSLSYMGEALRVLQATRGQEQAFLRSLQSEREPAGSNLGTVVALSYEFGVGLLGESPAPDDVEPAFALRPTTLLVLNHAMRRAELRGVSEDAIDAWLVRHGTALQRGQVDGLRAEAPEVFGHAWRRTDEQYLRNVAACKAAIREGEAYVLCLTDTAVASVRDIDPLQLYLELLNGGSAVRGAVIVTENRALVSVSPERFLSKRGNTLATHPIKGTRARGGTPAADAILAEELLSDPKERAENLMIVDLMRNDLSRICEPGTVRTEGFLRVESHPRVHQLVSTVRGEFRKGVDIVDAIRACFPGGSMTGAPKQRAVQLLAELEAAPRGLYSGCFGWLGDDGDAELAMCIRGIELRGKADGPQLAFVGAGGGITSDSDARLELAEKHLKATPLIAALGRSVSEYP